MKRIILTAVVALLLASTAGAVVSRGYGPFRIEWEVTPKGAIAGRVYNEYQLSVTRVRLLVEARDAADRVVARTFGYVFGVIGPLSDRYFTVAKLPPADHYQVSVESYTVADTDSGSR
jgi:hypothetical protein